MEAGSTVEIPFVDNPGFTEDQGVYANHCVPETWGAELEDGVKSRLHGLEGYRTSVQYVKKAQNHSVDSYSAFGDVSFLCLFSFLRSGSEDDRRREEEKRESGLTRLMTENRTNIDASQP